MEPKKNFDYLTEWLSPLISGLGIIISMFGIGAYIGEGFCLASLILLVVDRKHYITNKKQFWFAITALIITSIVMGLTIWYSLKPSK